MGQRTDAVRSAGHSSVHSHCKGSKKFKECTVHSWNTLFSCQPQGNGQAKALRALNQGIPSPQAEAAQPWELEKGRARAPPCTRAQVWTSPTPSPPPRPPSPWGLPGGLPSGGRHFRKFRLRSLRWCSAERTSACSLPVPAMGSALEEQCRVRDALRFFVQQLPRSTAPVQRNSLHLTGSGQEQGVLVSEGSTDTHTRVYVPVRQVTLPLAGTRGAQFN